MFRLIFWPLAAIVNFAMMTKIIFEYLWEPEPIWSVLMIVALFVYFCDFVARNIGGADQ